MINKNQTKSSSKELLESLVEIAGEIEAEYYNDKFGLYRQEVVDALLVKFKDVVSQLGQIGVDVEKEAEENEELEYALQFA